VRIVLALVLIAISVWAFAPYVAYRISSSAFVNAKIMRVTAPIPGYLSSDLPRKGRFVEHPEKLTLIQSYSVDRRRLLDLKRQRKVAIEKAELARKQLDELLAEDKTLKERMDAYREGMITRLGNEIREAQAEKSGCLEEVKHRRDIGTRMENLAKSGTTSQIRSQEALAKEQATETQCQMAVVRVERLQAELSSLEKGVYLRDAANDVPYSQQQRERLFLRRQELETVANEESARGAELAEEIDEEERHVEKQQSYELTFPKDHVVWSVPASPGSVVSEGQKVVDLADCDNRFVTVELPEREFENIKPGEPASVRMIGSDIWRTGYVRQVQGSAASADDRLLAAKVPVPTPGNITVEVSLPRQDAAIMNSSYCDIGRLADVRFQRDTPAFVERVGNFFRSALDMFRPTAKVARQ
jgi:multidrug resistance efflux pump